MAIVTSKKSTITADVFLPKMTLTLTFINGKEIVVDANSLNDDIRNMAILHGLKQKLVDAAAISRNLDTGMSASVDDKYNAVKKIADRLTSPDGKWNEGRSASSEDKPTAGVNNILVRALMKMKEADESYIRGWLGEKTKEQRAALRRNPRVVQIMAELQAATVVNGVNTDELLNELGMESPEEIAQMKADDAAIERERDESASGIQSEIEPNVHIAQRVQQAVSKPNTRTSKKRLVTTTAD
jgi:hypothetical protein